MISRIPVTVPAAGSFERISIRGRTVYVEESPANAPDDVPSFHLSSGGDGFPCYSRSRFSWLPGFREFYVKGTAASAGGTLYLLIFEDPCGEGVYGSGALIEPNPCGDTAAPEPDVTEPTHAIIVPSDGGRIQVVDSAGVIVRTLATTGSLETGRIHVDYGSSWVYYAAEDATASNFELRRVGIDGTGDVLIANLASIPAGASTVHVDWDPSIGEFWVTGNTTQGYRVTPGGTAVLLGWNAGVNGLCGLRNGTHVFSLGSSQCDRMTFGGTNTDALSQGLSSCRADELGDQLLGRLGGVIYTIDRTDVDLINSVVSGLTGSPTALSIYSRWLFYVDNGTLKRLNLDDLSTVVETAVAPGTCKDAWPWID